MTTTTTCNLFSFVPFTYGEFYGTDVFIDNKNSYNLGYSHMAAASIAINHFNNRNTSIVPELMDDNIQSCNITLSSNFYDTGVFTHTSTRNFQQALHEHDDNPPCAIAGPYSDLPSQILGGMAASLSIPLVAHRALNLRSTLAFYSPYSNQVYPDQHTLGYVLLNYLFHTGRNNYAAVLYPVMDTSIQLQEIIMNVMNEHNFTHKTYSFDYVIKDQAAEDANKHSVMQAFEKMKNDGYRTIVVVMEASSYELALLANAAETLQMSNEDYVWIFLGIDLNSIIYPQFRLDDNIALARFLAGGTALAAIEGFQADPDNDPFLKAWQSQDAQFVEYVNSLQTISEGRPGYYQAQPDYFQKYRPGTGSAYMYDAVMAIGIGACAAYNHDKNMMFGITPHLAGIRATDFHGATGRVRFGSDYEYPGARDPTYVQYAVVNLFRPFAEELDENNWQTIFNNNPISSLFPITATLESQGNNISESQWKDIMPFLYHNGSTDPPLLLRNAPEQNYLDNSLRIFGLTMMSIVLAAAFVASIWVYGSRKHQVVRRNQPYALQAICFGSFVTAWGILPLSFDENDGWSTDQLDIGCNAVVWLVVLGYLITYGALFAKLWRVDKVLQFRRREVRAAHVAWPATALCLAAVGILTAMTIADPLRYERIEINADTGESIGHCATDDAAFLWPLAVVMVLSTFLTGLMAYKTLDVDSSFSDASWVFALILVHLEVILLGMPVASILSDLNTNGRYFGIVFIIFTFPTSSLGLIILPKIVAYRRWGARTKSKRGTGGSGQVHVYRMESYQGTGTNHRPAASSDLTTTTTTSPLYNNSVVNSNSIQNNDSVVKSNINKPNNNIDVNDDGKKNIKNSTNSKGVDIVRVVQPNRIEC